MKYLYEVKTKKWKTFYVMASEFNEANYKVEEFLINQDNSSILDTDGSLKKDYEPDEVTEIKQLSDKSTNILL